MKVLITGANGLVGQALGRELTRNKVAVVALVRNATHARETLTYPCEVFSWDGGRELPPQEAFDGVTHVIHLAGENIAAKRWSDERKRQLVESRVRSTQFLRQRIQTLAQKPEYFLSASAVGFYGNRGDELLNEKSSRGQGFLSDLCEAWEKSVREIQELGVNTLSARFGVVVSELGGALEKMLPVAQLGFLGPIGLGGQWMSWIALPDLVQAIIFCCENKIPGVRNFCSPYAVTQKEFTEELCRAVARPMGPPVPPLALKVMYGEMSHVLTDSQRVVDVELEKDGFEFKHAKIADAFSDLFPTHKGGEYWKIDFQYFKQPRAEVFDFFKRETNLERITPEFLGFKVLSKSTEDIREGTVITYRIKVHGIPLEWVTLIRKFKENEVFIDTQEKGPYAKWHHTHSFEDLGSGTLVTDRVVFKLPVGWLGQLGGYWKVKNDVDQIFAYRRKVMAEIFPQTQD